MENGRRLLTNEAAENMEKNGMMQELKKSKMYLMISSLRQNI
jgi:hypothetical protein